jgi:hypothetical protein
MTICDHCTANNRDTNVLPYRLVLDLPDPQGEEEPITISYSFIDLCDACKLTFVKSVVDNAKYIDQTAGG